MNEIYNQNPKFHLAVDCVIFGYEAGELKLLLFHRVIEPCKGEWSLMGGFMRSDESLEDAARRVLFQTTGLENIFLEQIGAFSKVDREPGTRVISVTFVALIRLNEHDRNSVGELGAQWWPVAEIPKLIFDHEEMVAKAMKSLQNKAASELVGRELLPEIFTLTQLRVLYETIFQKSFEPGNFRKKVLSLNILERLNLKNTTESKKGAFYYRFKDGQQVPEGQLLFHVNR